MTAAELAAVEVTVWLSADLAGRLWEEQQHLGPEAVTELLERALRAELERVHDLR